MLSDEEYVARRRKLQEEELRLRQASQKQHEPLALELGRAVILFRKCAADWFLAGSIEDKRLILQTVGSNSVLANRKLNIQARFPFKPAEKSTDSLHLWAVVDYVGTQREDEVPGIINAVEKLAERHRPELPMAA